MVILDIDLDFFLKDIVHDPKQKRPNDSDYDIWEIDEVIFFLEQNCKLNENKKIKGKLLETHDELFYCFKNMIEQEILEVPFKIVHIDAHADLGLGDCSHEYIMTELLHKKVYDRTNPKKGGWYGLSEVNFLAFAIACRWIKQITYVHHQRVHVQNIDIAESMKKNFDFNSSIIQLKKISPEECERKGDIRNCTPIELETEVPIELIDADSYISKDEFAYMFLTRSPKYTPPKADKLIPIIINYIDKTLNI